MRWSPLKHLRWKGRGGRDSAVKEVGRDGGGHASALHTFEVRKWTTALAPAQRISEGSGGCKRATPESRKSKLERDNF